MQVSQPTSFVHIPPIEAHCCLFRDLLPKQKEFPCCLEIKEIFYITNLVMLLLPNFTLRLEFKYLNVAFRIP